MERHEISGGSSFAKNDTSKEIKIQKTLIYCPECGSVLTTTGRCYACPICGFEACGWCSVSQAQL